MAEALRLSLIAEDLGEVTHRLNAFLDVLASLTELPIERVEPVPTLLESDQAP